MDTHADEPIYGLMAEFAEPDALIDAARRARAEGYRQLEAFTPYPVHGLSEALARPPTRMPLIVLIGGIVGGVSGYLMQYWTMAVDYPFNVGGRPLHSWPAFIPVTFETTILVAALSGVFGMLLLNKLPQPYHPVFNVPQFKRASQDRFFLCVSSNDPQFDESRTSQFLNTLGAESVEVVEP